MAATEHLHSSATATGMGCLQWTSSVVQCTVVRSPPPAPVQSQAALNGTYSVQALASAPSSPQRQGSGFSRVVFLCEHKRGPDRTARPILAAAERLLTTGTSSSLFSTYPTVNSRDSHGFQDIFARHVTSTPGLRKAASQDSPKDLNRARLRSLTSLAEAFGSSI